MAEIPVATYRVQLQPGFGFNEAARVLDYLADLGISHLYASPYLQAAPGSTHGYDVVDHVKINTELGGAAGHELLCDELRKKGMGQILDIVPNHMSISSADNTWWWDVLENGQSSPYASYFDVDWAPVDSRFGNKILLPILGDHFGRVLEAGEIRLDRRDGTFIIRYHEQAFPVDPRSIAPLLSRAGEDLENDELLFISDSLSSLPLHCATDRASTRRRHRDKEIIRNLLARILSENLEAARITDALIKEINVHPDSLESLLDRQNYRLAFWRTASQDLGYRRFFDINSLVGLRMEDEDVFGDSHRLILSWLKEGALDGVRIDHPDGLRDPAAYLGRLRRASPGTWLIVEKITGPDERIRTDWPVDGTTGYEFIHLLTHLLTCPEGEAELTRLYSEFTGEGRRYEEILREKKSDIIDRLFGSDVNRLASLMLSICEHHRRYRDYSRPEISRALRILVACFPVYRTYVNAREGWISDDDRKIIGKVIDDARGQAPEIDPDLIGFIGDVLLLNVTGELESELVMRLQQLTPPVMAKGAEDTAFYCFNRFIAHNEVGGDPGSFGIDPGLFHSRMRERLESHPFTMLTTSTHDTKRSEDIRARLVLLSEISEKWTAAVRRWSAMADPYRKGEFPDRNTEYFLYQTLVGAWPIGTERLLGYMEKASREAKIHTSWIEPDQAYDEALSFFVTGLVEDPEFVADLASFVDELVEPGRINSLSQTLIKLTAPGVPDTYQGCDLWDLSLVDPDNRRSVDFDTRRSMLEWLDDLNEDQILPHMDTGLPKLWVIRQALTVRRSIPEAFGERGTYEPIAFSGPKADFAFGFLRGGTAAVIIPRFVLKRGGSWDGTRAELPEGRWKNVLSGEGIAGPHPVMDDLLRTFPVALLVKEDTIGKQELAKRSYRGA